MSQGKHWSQMSEAGALWGIRALLWCFNLFGRGIFRICLWPVIVYFFLRRGPARKASLDFFKRLRAGDEKPLTSRQAYWQSMRHFLCFGELLLDKLAVWQGRFDGEVVMHGRAALVEDISAKRGAILLVSHLGNTEVCQSLTEQVGFARINVLIHTEHAKNFNRLLAAKQQAKQVNLVPVSSVDPATAMLLEQRLQQGELVAIAADRTPLPNKSGTPMRHVQANFLGQSADFPQGPFVLAALLKRPVYFLCAVKTGNRYDIYVERLADCFTMDRRDRTGSLSAAVQLYADRLAYFTKRFPLQWGNFYDFWRRS